MEAMITPRMDFAQAVQTAVAAASAAHPEAPAQEHRGASAQEEQAGEVVVVDHTFPETQEEEVEDHQTDRAAMVQMDPADQVDLVDQADLEDPEALAAEVAGPSSNLASDIPTTGTSTERCQRTSCHGMAAGRRIKASGI